MNRVTATLTASVIIACTGLMNGWLSGRWLPATELRSLDEAMPNDLENWVVYSPEGAEIDLPPKSGETARTIRHYSRRSNREVIVSVLIVRGEPAPMVYNPLICYDGNGYLRHGQPQPRSMPETGDKLWEIDLTKPGAESSVRVRWAWSENGTWQIPESPRMAFLRSRELYKIYVVSQVASDSTPNTVDPSLSFLKEFLPALRKELTPLADSGRP